MKMPKLTTPVILIIIAAILLTIAVTYAVVSWSQTIKWTAENPSFTAPSNPTTLDYEIVKIGTEKTETYTIKNNGNVAITVYASTSGTGFTASWDKPSATLTVGEETTFTLTLTITGTGSCTVTLSLQVSPKPPLTNP